MSDTINIPAERLQLLLELNNSYLEELKFLAATLSEITRLIGPLGKIDMVSIAWKLPGIIQSVQNFDADKLNQALQILEKYGNANEETPHQ
jgi:hypothetical protein